MKTSTSAHGATGAWVRKRGRSSLAVASCSRTAAETTSSCRGSGVPATNVSARQPGDHVAAVGRADRPGQPHTVDEQRLAHLGRPRGAGVVGDHRQHDFAAAPAALPAGAERDRPHTAQSERRQHMIRRRFDSHHLSLSADSANTARPGDEPIAWRIIRSIVVGGMCNCAHEMPRYTAFKFAWTRPPSSNVL